MDTHFARQLELSGVASRSSLDQLVPGRYQSIGGSVRLDGERQSLHRGLGIAPFRENLPCDAQGDQEVLLWTHGRRGSRAAAFPARKQLHSTVQGARFHQRHFLLSRQFRIVLTFAAATQPRSLGHILFSQRRIVALQMKAGRAPIAADELASGGAAVAIVLIMSPSVTRRWCLLGTWGIVVVRFQ